MIRVSRQERLSGNFSDHLTSQRTIFPVKIGLTKLSIDELFGL